MLRIAICEKEKAEGLRWRALVDRFADISRINNVESYIMSSLEELETLINRVRPNLLNLVVIRIEPENEEQRTEIVGKLESFRERTPNTRFILTSTDISCALCSYAAGAQFLELPLNQDGFIRTVGTALRKLSSDEKRPFPVKVAKGAVNMNLNDISFAETNKKGPIVHLPDSRIVSTKGTLQALYDQMSKIDERFIRAGGSFIINLDNIRTVGESSVVFSDGETIILPVRARKPVREAYASYLKGA